MAKANIRWDRGVPTIHVAGAMGRPSDPVLTIGEVLAVLMRERAGTPIFLRGLGTERLAALAKRTEISMEESDDGGRRSSSSCRIVDLRGKAGSTP